MHPLINNCIIGQCFIQDSEGNLFPLNDIQEVRELSNDDKRYDDDFAARICSEPFAELTGTIQMSKKQTKKMFKFFYSDMNRQRRWYRRMKRAKEKARRERLKHHDN